ncbi:MAG TPA: hypothetical protein VNU46_00555 [Gemmatimonadaceae bacterium]|jgi:hypothetical protein|nr:hypothetical protein [Gemmatimonadaceae bacterium]
MLRTFIVLGLLVVVGSALIGLVLGVAGMLLWIILKLAIVGAILYLAIRIVSPKTAARIREKIEAQSLPRL